MIEAVRMLRRFMIVPPSNCSRHHHCLCPFQGTWRTPRDDLLAKRDAEALAATGSPHSRQNFALAGSSV